MSTWRICYVCDSLFPFEWTDNALNMAFRAGADAASGQDVVLLHQVVRPLSRAHYQAATDYHRKRGVTLVISPRRAEGMPDDLKVAVRHASAPSVLTHVRLDKLSADNPFDVIHVSAHGGMALRLLQARQTGSGVGHARLVVHLDQLETADQHLGRKRGLSMRDLAVRFHESECLRLSEETVCMDPGFADFLSERFALDIPGLRVDPMPPPPGEAAALRTGANSGAALLAHSLNAPLLGDFQRLAAMARGDARFAVYTPACRKSVFENPEDPPHPSRPTPRPLPNAAALIRRLIADRAVVVAPTPWTSPTIHWLAARGIPMVFPRSGRCCALPSHAGRGDGPVFSEGRANELLDALKTVWSGGAVPPPTPPPPAPRRDIPAPEHTGMTPPSGGEPTTPVTVAVSHYNLGEMMRETLDALDRQTYPHMRVVVVDDGSTDPDALAFFRSCQARYKRFEFIELPHEGYWSPRNHVIENTADPLIIIVDGDNLPVPEMVADYVRAMERCPQTDSMSCYISSFDDGKRGETGGHVFKATHFPSGGDVVCGLRRNVFGDTNAIFRTAAIREVGGFRRAFDNPYADWDIFLRLVTTGHRHDVVPKVLLHYRSHAGSMIRQRDAFLAEVDLVRLHQPTGWRLDAASERRLTLALHGLLE